MDKRFSPTCRVIGVVNGSRRFRDCLTLPILRKLAYINGVPTTSGESRWDATLKCIFCDVPPLDLSRYLDIKPQGVLTWIPESSPTAKIGQFFRIYVAENEIMCWCYLTPFMSICSDAYRYVYLNPYRECYTNIYRVIGVILLAIS